MAEDPIDSADSFSSTIEELQNMACNINVSDVETDENTISNLLQPHDLRYCKEATKTSCNSGKGKPTTMIELPSNLRANLTMNPTSTESRLKSQLLLDGILISSRSLSIISPTCETTFFQTAKTKHVNVINGEKFTGLASFHDKRVYSVHLCNIGPWKVSVAYLVDNFLPRTYVKKIEFNKRVIEIIRKAVIETSNNAINNRFSRRDLPYFLTPSNQWTVPAKKFDEFSLILRENLVKDFETYCGKFNAVMKQNKTEQHTLNFNSELNPEIVDDFKDYGALPFTTSKKLDEGLEDFVVFTLERVGLEMPIPKQIIPCLDTVPDDKQYRQQLDQTKSFLSTFRKGLSTDEDKLKLNDAHVVFHIAQDFYMERDKSMYQDNNLLLFWNIQNVQEATKEWCSYETFHVFALPGAGNLRSKGKLPHNLNFYARLGDTLRHNVNKWFCDTRITETLFGMLRPTTFQQKKKPYPTHILEYVEAQNPVYIMRKIVEYCCNTKCPSEARFEKSEVVEMEGDIEIDFLVAMNRFVKFTTNDFILSDSKLFVAVEPSSMKTWFNRTIVPAVNVLQSSIELFHPKKDKISEEAKMSKKLEKPAKLDTLLDIANDALYSELLVSYMMNGYLNHGLKSKFLKDLGLDLLPSLSLGDKFSLTNVKIKNEMLTFSSAEGPFGL